MVPQRPGVRFLSFSWASDRHVWVLPALLAAGCMPIEQRGCSRQLAPRGLDQTAQHL
jgi:hypothetical protein